MSSWRTMYQHVPNDVSETSLRGRVLSIFAAIAIGSLFVLETKAYLSTKLETDLSLRSVYEIEEQQIRLNFDITLMDLSCDLATVDVYSSVGHRKNITANIIKHPVDENGVRQRYEARNWHEDDFELWDPAVHEEIGPLHEDGEDALNLSDKSFEYGECINSRARRSRWSCSHSAKLPSQRSRSSSLCL